MGCDGGTIPRRDELVRTKKKPEKVDKNAENVAKWKHCAISQDPLRKPIVSCELGKLYNKEAVIEHLLNKESPSEVASHITKLSDVKELNLTEKNGYTTKNDQKGDEYVDFHDSRFICPVTGMEMNGTQRFCFLLKCGCVLSEKAVKEVKSETCHKCGKPFDSDDIIIINGSEEEVAVLTTKMQERRKLAKLEKKKKKALSSEAGPVEKKIKIETGESSGIKPEPGSKITNGTNAIESEEKQSKIKSEGNINGTKNDIKQPYVKNSKNILLPDKAQKSYSIAKDPNASDAFKSLFTTHKSAKVQEKAHWITHNPLYF